MSKTKVRLLRPLDGHDIGTVRSFDKADAERLAEAGAVTILGPEKAPRPRRPKAAERPANKKAQEPANKSA